MGNLYSNINSIQINNDENQEINISSITNFTSGSEIVNYMKKEREAIFPFAYSLVNNHSDITKKYNLLVNPNKYTLIASPINKSICKVYDFRSELAKNSLIQGAINVENGLNLNFLGFFGVGVNWGRENSTNNFLQSNDKTYKKVISFVFQKAKVRIPTDEIKIVPEVENSIREILLGDKQKTYSNEEKYNLLCEYLEEHGQIIPTSVIIGAKYDYLLEANDKTTLNKVEENIKNQFSLNLNGKKSLEVSNEATININDQLDFITNNISNNNKNFNSQGVKVNVFNVGSSLSTSNLKLWQQNLDKKYYDIIGVDESYDIIKFLSPEIKKAAEDVYKNLNFNKLHKLKIEKKIKNLISTDFNYKQIAFIDRRMSASLTDSELQSISSLNYNSETDCKNGMCEGKNEWIFGVTPEILKKFKIPFQTKEFIEYRHTLTSTEKIFGSIFSVGVWTSLGTAVLGPVGGVGACALTGLVFSSSNASDNTCEEEKRTISEYFTEKMIIGYKITSSESNCKCKWIRETDKNIESSSFRLTFFFSKNCQSRFKVEVYLVDK